MGSRILLMRHGHSVANAQGLIISRPPRGVESYGLSDQGVAEVHRRLEEQSGVFERIDGIFASDFLRTQQTAEIVARHLSVTLETSPALRERDFGQFDGGSNQFYQQVWEQDRADPQHRQWNVESVAAVAERMMSFVQQLDPHQDRTWLLVSHGDPLQILLTAFAGRDLRTHREVAEIKTAETRSLSGSLEQGN